MNAEISRAPRILILESDPRTVAAMRRHALNSWAGASIRSSPAPLADLARQPAELKAFDVIFAGCDFTADGSSRNPVFATLRAISADPETPPIILVTHGGSEYTAVLATRAGAFDYIPRQLLGREQVRTAVQKALERYRPPGGSDGMIELFGYDMRRCLAQHDNVSVHVAYSAERAAEVVLKVLHRGRGSLSGDANFERLVDEFKLLYDIDDRAVAQIYDFRVTRRWCYIAMEYFRHGHLGMRLSEPLGSEEALRHAVEIAKALSIVHAAGVVHRDLKPANVMLRDDGSIALIDFGISQAAFHRHRPSPASSAITGTPYYMSPEQAKGQPTDERTDLYALGVILYQMLTGRKPYVGDSADEILERHCEDPVPLLPAPLAHLQPLIDRLLAKRPGQRVSTARELIEAIDAARASVSAPDYGLTVTS